MGKQTLQLANSFHLQVWNRMVEAQDLDLVEQQVEDLIRSWQALTSLSCSSTSFKIRHSCSNAAKVQRGGYVTEGWIWTYRRTKVHTGNFSESSRFLQYKAPPVRELSHKWYSNVCSWTVPKRKFKRGEGKKNGIRKSLPLRIICIARKPTPLHLSRRLEHQLY